MTINIGVDLTADLINDEFAGLLTAFGARNTVSTAQSTTSTSFTDLATTGPAVTLTSVGTRALILLSARCWDGTSTSNLGGMGFAISGATTLSAQDANALLANGATGSSGGGVGVNYGMIISVDITAGTNTFTAKYKSAAGSSFTFADRKLFVFAP